MLRKVDRTPGHMLAGSKAAEILPELTHLDGIIIPHDEGVSRFPGTIIQARLRALDIDTLAATGVSINLALFGMCADGVALGVQDDFGRRLRRGFPEDYKSHASFARNNS